MSLEGNAKGYVIAISYREFFFYLYFAVMFGMRMWGVYEGTKQYATLLIFGLCFWGISVLMTEHNVCEYVVMAALLSVAVVAYLNSGEKGLLLYFTLMLGMKGINIKKLFKVGIFVGGVGLFLNAFLASFGIIEEVVYLQTRAAVGTEFRHSLGMPHPNTLSTSFFIISVMIMYIVEYKDRIVVLRISGILMAIAIYFFIYSGSRTGIVITLGFLALNLLYSYRRRIGAIEKIVASILFPIIWGISIILPMVASDDLVKELMNIDFTLMSRIQHAKNNLRYSPVTMFGTRVVNPETYYGVDIAQLYLLLNYGIIAFAIVTALYILLVSYEVRENKIRELLITVMFLVMGLTDPFLYNISYKNISFVFIGVMFYKYMEKVTKPIPFHCAHNVQILKFGSLEFELKIPVSFENFRLDCMKIGSGQRRIMFISAVAIAITISMLIYIATPTPAYVLTDRNIGEHKVLNGLEGRTYSKEEVQEIKRQGNIVINYTDENELMYTYYSDKNNPVEKGYYCGNAAVIEKVRRSISIFFWGTIFLLGVFNAWDCVRYITGFKNEQGHL